MQENIKISLDIQCHKNELFLNFILMTYQPLRVV